MRTKKEYTTIDINKNDGHVVKHVVCDICGNEFNAKIKELHFIPKYKWTVIGFRCPYCKKEYINYVANNELRNGIYKASQLKIEYDRLDILRKNEYEQYTSRNKPIPKFITQKWMDKMNKVYSKYIEQREKNNKLGKLLKKQYNDYILKKEE